MAASIDRRGLGGLAAATLASACVAPSGLSAGAAGTAAPPLPCASQAGDVVGLLLDGSGAPAGTVMVFGQAFRPGDLPRGAGLAARLVPGGQALPTQLDVAARHADGSTRFAIVSLAAPALRDGEWAGVILARASVGQATRLDASALAGRQAVVEMAPANSRDVWRADLIALARAAAQSSSAVWQSGPLASQWRVSQAVPDSVAGCRSLRLVVDLAVRSDGTLWADVWLRNDIAMRPGGGRAAYAMRVLLDGREAIRAEGLRQAQYTGWGRLLGSSGRERAAHRPPLTRVDPGYLAELGAAARYDVSTGVDEAVLSRLGAAVASPAWAAPLGARGVTQYMPTTGGRGDIGPATEAQAIWLITGDRRAAAFAIGQAETAGSVPWHLWDPSGGAGGQGGWMDTRHWPRLWVDYRGGPPPGGLLQPVPDNTGWSPDDAHQPDLAFLPYVMTGRRALLDELQAQASWCVMRAWPAAEARGTFGSNEPGGGVNVVRGVQVRGGAWSLRQLGEAAWISPEADAQRPWLAAAAAGNWAWLRARLPEWTAQQGESHGWIPSENRSSGLLAPWQQDYFASTAAAAARRGDGDARAVLAWMANFLVGRFLAADRGFPPAFGVAYQVAYAPEATGTAFFQTWRQVSAATRERAQASEDWARQDGTYVQLALQSLAALQDVLGSADAARAYALVLASGARDIRPEDFRRNPGFNITPRDKPRLLSRSSRCAAVPVRG